MAVWLYGCRMKSRGRVSVGFGNWGRYEATADVSDKITKSGNVRYRLAAIGVTQGTQTDHVDYKRVGVLPSITWDIDKKTSLTLLGSYMYTPGTGITTAAHYPVVGTLIDGPNGRIARSTFLSTPNWNANSATDAMFEYQFNHNFNKFVNFSQTFRWEKSDFNGKETFWDGQKVPGQVYIRPEWIPGYLGDCNSGYTSLWEIQHWSSQPYMGGRIRFSKLSR